MLSKANKPNEEIKDAKQTNDNKKQPEHLICINISREIYWYEINQKKSVTRLQWSGGTRQWSCDRTRHHFAYDYNFDANVMLNTHTPKGVSSCIAFNWSLCVFRLCQEKKFVHLFDFNSEIQFHICNFRWIAKSTYKFNVFNSVYASHEIGWLALLLNNLCGDCYYLVLWMDQWLRVGGTIVFGTRICYIK